MSKTILIAEDEKALRDILHTKFEESGFKVLECGDGEECVRLAEENKPDVLLLDIIMPKKDGMELIKDFSVSEWSRKIPIVVLSNKSDYGTQHEAWYYGVKVYLVKAETSLEDVIKRVKEIVFFD